MPTDISADIAAVQGIAAVPRILEVVCRSTGAMDRLFQPFYRVSDQNSHEGLGLGLYVASEIARAHTGTLTVASSPEETRFTFRMPLSA